MARHRFPLTRLIIASALLSLALGSTPVAAQDATPPGTGPGAGRTLVYHELTAFPAHVNDGGEEAPLLSADGQHVAFTRAPGDPDPAQPGQRISRIFVMAADGTNQHEVDAYPQFCYCGAAIDLSADGSTIISTDSVQLRVAAAGGERGRALLALNSNELNAARISGDGTKVFFRVYRDTSLRGSSPAQPIARGIWVINADGSGLRQLVSARQLEALGLPATDFVGSFPPTLDASFDGARLVFGAFHDPKEGGVGQGLFAVNGDGTGLRELVGRVAFIVTAALSADGTTVAYNADLADGSRQVGVLPFTGGTPRLLVTGSQDLPAAGGGIPDSGDRMQLSRDGRLALLGSSGVLADTRTGDLLALGVDGPDLAAGAARLVGNGLYRATMDAAADRVLYLAGDAAGVLQVVRLDLDPADRGQAPTLAEAAIAPGSVPLAGAAGATVAVHVAATGTVVGVGATVLRGGLHDPHVGIVDLYDDGSNGDATAGDGIYTSNRVAADCCAAPGPRTVRVLAQVVGADGKRHATAVDTGPFAVAAPAATPTP